MTSGVLGARPQRAAWLSSTLAYIIHWHPEMRRRLKHIKKKILLVGIVPVIFLVLGIWTLPHYGINWDEPFHFMRGQAYLHYYLTGEKDYKSLPSYPRLAPRCPQRVKDCSTSPLGPFDTTEYQGNITYEEAVFKNQPRSLFLFKRSYYQNDNYTFPEIIASEEGHPSFGDILAALTNKIFYQHLNIIDDIEGYHLFEVLASFAIVLGVAVFVYYHYGVFASVVAAASLASYPLFFSESHFNIKDPPLAAFFGLTLITFYFGIVKNKWKLVITSVVLAGMAMGIKFNAAFLPIIVISWLVIFVIKLFLDHGKEIFKPSQLKSVQPVLLSLIAYPFVAVVVFYAIWPFLWSDPLGNFLKIANFYKQIGTGTPHELKEYIVHGWNTYPALWIFYTTPIPILILSAVGIAGSLFEFLFKRKHFVLLILLWFLVPILRVSWPNSSIYGGVRQIMEFVPALAILAGLGGYYLVKLSSFVGGIARTIVIVAVVGSLLFVVYEDVQIHPNENVYFNQIIGGLSGARERKIPYWGNSYGNVYQQGIEWLNANAEPGARLGFPVSTGGNLARVKLRPDIWYWNAHWSGPNMGGEYEMELDFDWGPKEWYSYAYYDTFVDPVYVAQVDGVALLKIWKNDLAHTRPGYEKEVEYKTSSVSIMEGQMKIDVGEAIPLTKVVVEHGKTGCETQRGGFMETSEDGITWKRDPETIAAPQVPVNVNGWDEDTFVFMFAARRGRFITINTQMDNSCILKNPQITVKGLK